MDNSALMYYVFHIDRSRIKFAAISANPQRLRRTLFGCQVTMPKSSAHAPGSFANRLADCVGKACGLPGESGMVCCDACSRWIHLSCAGLEGRRASQIERLLTWHCEACLQESSAECDACKYGAHRPHTCLKAQAQTKANQQEKDRKEAKAQAKAQTKAQTEANQQAQRDNRKEARQPGRQEFVHFTAGVDPRLPVISLLPVMKVKNCQSHVGRI